MKMNLNECWALLVVALAHLSLAVETNVVTYTAPAEAKTSTDFTVTVNGQPLTVYKDVRYYFVIFSMAGTVTMNVSWTLPFTTAIVRPLSHKITPTVSGKSATFTFAGPRNISFESNDTYADPQTLPALFIFANPLEVNIPSPTDPGVEYFGPGYHDIGAYSVTAAKKTIYLAGGAYCRGKIRIDGINDVLIYGRGILYSDFPGTGESTEYSAININNCSGFRLQGITTTHNGTWAWTTTFRGASRSTVDNYHVVAYHQNDDGFQPAASWCTFNRIFSAGDDDDYSYSSGTHHVYLNCVARAGRARPFQIWAGVYGFYKGCDAIGTKTSAPDCPAILFEGEGKNTNFRFENFNIEIQNNWLYVTGPNHYFKNVNVLYNTAIAENDGAQNLTFENLQIAGKKILKAADALNFSSNGAIFKDSDPTAPTVSITSPTRWDSCDVVTGPDVTLKFAINNWAMASGGKGYHYFVNNVDKGVKYTVEPIEIAGLPIGPNSINVKLTDAAGAYTTVQDAVVFTVTNESKTVNPHRRAAAGFKNRTGGPCELISINGRLVKRANPRALESKPGVYVVRQAGADASRILVQ